MARKRSASRGAKIRSRLDYLNKLLQVPTGKTYSTLTQARQAWKQLKRQERAMNLLQTTTKTSDPS